jgi:uncharacterized phiE125 gp8 family phage protein
MKVTNHFFTPDSTDDTALVTLEQVKKQLRLEADFEEEDDLIQGYINAAVAAAEDYTGRVLNPGVKTFELDSLSATFEFTQSADNDTVKSIVFYAPDATETTAMEDTNYKLRKSSTIGCKEIKFESYPETAERDDAVIIEIQQGYEPETLPKPIYQAILLMVTSMYERREDIGEIGNNSASRSLMRPYRNY